MAHAPQPVQSAARIDTAPALPMLIAPVRGDPGVTPRRALLALRERDRVDAFEEANVVALADVLPQRVKVEVPEVAARLVGAEVGEEGTRLVERLAETGERDLRLRLADQPVELAKDPAERPQTTGSYARMLAEAAGETP